MIRKHYYLLFFLVSAANFGFAQNEPSPGILDQETIGQLSTSEKSMVIEYFDELGRPVQVIAAKAAAGGKDIISFVEYDDQGRQPFRYLAYAQSPSRSGEFRQDPKLEQSAYYASSPAGIAQDARPFSDTLYEASPIGRPLKSWDVGADWKENDKGVAVVTRFNTAAEGIRRWKYHTSGLPVLPGGKVITENGSTYFGFFPK